MTKKIIAIALAVALIAGCFAGCSKKENQVVSHNKEYEAVKDKDGNYIYDDDGELAVYQKDENGNIKKDENGEPLTVYVENKNVMVEKNRISTQYYRFNCKKDWKINDLGRVNLNEDDYIEITVITEGKDKKADLNAYLAKQTESIEAFKKAFDEAGIKYEIAESGGEITPKGVAYRSSETIVEKLPESETGYYSQAVYVAYDSEIYIITYVCNKGKTDSTIDLVAYLQDNIVFI